MHCFIRHRKTHELVLLKFKKYVDQNSIATINNVYDLYVQKEICHKHMNDL